ncbi:hypothetical protein ACFVWG_33020 [Kribbella sp. NPDC058245]|uniref:hypothetical protein n=1 Tax=Kribbella sp. NPDC058245 TaxID=3346399 RepID=UPI0036E26675
MTTDAYEYLVRVFEPAGESVDHPSGLWRHRGDDFEYLSMVDWSWHPRGEVPLPHPDLRVAISAEQAHTLLEDRQRFVRYWAEHLSPENGDLVEDRLVYRQLRSPERLVEEGFGRDNAWVSTRTIRDFQVGGPHDVPDLHPIDATTAEQLIQETRGVSGATNLLDEFTQLKGSTS